MAFCGFGRGYQSFDSDKLPKISYDNGECLRGVKNCFGNFFTDCRNFLIDLGIPLENEHIGQVIDVRPICPVDQMPRGYRNGRCYHIIKLADGSQFKLIFSNIAFDTIKDQLRPKRMVRITYKDPDYRVINVYPQRLYHTMDFDEFLEGYSEEIANNARVRVCTLDNRILKVEFMDQGLFEDSDSDSGERIEIKHSDEFHDLDLV